MVLLSQAVAALAVMASAGAPLAAAFPADLNDWVARNESQGPFADFPPVLTARQNGVQLRILSLGASIMSGQGSPEHSGLRKWVRMALRHDGWDVNMVGTKQDGSDMTDKDHEAKPGALIRDIRGYLKASLPYKPNLVIINGGTNNANGLVDVAESYGIMEGIVNDIWNYPDMSDTCVILSTLLPGKYTSDAYAAKQQIDANYRLLVKDKQGSKCIYVADMEPLGQPNEFLDINGPYWDDDIHPNNEGHRRAAYIFYAAIHRALSADKVKQAAPKEEIDRSGCDKVFGNGIYAGALTQQGWGEHDGIYYHSSHDEGIKLEIESKWDRNQWRFARLFSRDYDDFVGWYEEPVGTHRFAVWKNSADGQGNFKRIDNMFPDLFCNPNGVNFIDMNADGLDDLVCIGPDGNAYLSVNQGNGNGNSPPSFRRVSDTALIKTGEPGYGQNRVRMADIDGDGRGDYGVIWSDNKVHFWRNGGTKDIPEYWQNLGIRSQISSGLENQPSDGHANGVRFEDINGDGRDDSLWMGQFGQTTTWTNGRSCASGRDGDGLNVYWRQGFAAGASSGPTHRGFLEWTDPTNELGVPRERIHFARIFGRKPAFGNLGVQDYVFIEPSKLGDESYKFKLHVIKNLGSGGTKLMSDGNKYCNMMGHSNGQMDYVWTWSDGRMHLFPNAGKTLINKGESFWGPSPGDIWTPPQQLDRRDLHLADWDNDGDCDIIHVNPTNGNIRVWINDYPTKKTWNGAFREISAPGLSCSEKRGIGIDDLAVRFADLTSNGRADYLCIAKDGTVKGSLHNDDGSFTNVGQIKFAEGKDRANLRWADVNGDGKDDMIWVDKFNGDGHVWYNGGRGSPADNGGSSFFWRKISDPVYDGNHAGTCMFYPDLDGNGRADMHSIIGTMNNQAETWYNPSCGLRDAEGDDPEGVVDPHLPQQPNNPIGGPGPGEDVDCTELDKDPWRSVTCSNKFIESHIDYTPADRWNGLEVDAAWKAGLAYIQCRIGEGKPPNSFSNVVSDFFHGPQDMHCHVWNPDTNSCSGTSMLCQDVPRSPVGYFVLNSFKRLFSTNWSLYRAFETATHSLDLASLASAFGIPKDDKGNNAPVAIILDAIIFGYGLIMGPMWSKFFIPRMGGGTTPGAVKDTVNDIVKNSATLAKDIYARNSASQPKDEVGLQTAIRGVFLAMAEAYGNSTAEMNRALFDGSATSIGRLTTLMAEGRLFSRDLIEETDQQELTARLKTVIAAYAIPLTWQMSPETIWPVIIMEPVDCQGAPSFDWFGRYPSITEKAYAKRFCKGDESYFLLAPKNYKKTCDSTQDPTECDPFDLPPGFEKLEDSSFGLGWGQLMDGAINTWKANGRKNTGTIPELTNEVLDNILDNAVTTPHVINIPICSMKEARANWDLAYRNELKPGANFPCN